MVDGGAQSDDEVKDEYDHCRNIRSRPHKGLTPDNF